MRRHRRMRRRMRRRLVIGGAVVLAVGATATKMSKSEVEQVEQHTGMKAEDLSEEQLDAAMEELGIEGQEPTDQEIAMLEAEEDKAAGQPAADSAPAQQAPASQGDLISQLERLGALKAQGILTEEEFAAQKAKLLGS
jgi:hypothetical protein